jgi:hypothetical protein
VSVKVMSLVWENFNRGGSEKLAMLALADWCNDQGGSLHPSINSIAHKINVSESQARRIVHGFINDGYLTVLANHNGGDRGQTRHYKLNVEMLATPSTSATRTPSIDATPCADATPSMDAREPLAPMRATPSTHDTLTTIEPSIEPPIKNKAKKPAFVLPDWINQKHWDAWHLHPKRKSLSNEQKQLAVDQLKEWKDAGLDYETALKNSATNNWQGIFLPAQGKAVNGQPKTKMDISGIDYKAGVNPDGSF